MLDHDHLLRVDVVGLEQPGACDGALGDDPVGRAGELLDDAALLRGRRRQDGVQDDGHRHRQPCDQLEDVVAVAAAEDAELVLDDDRVEAAENFGGSGERVGRAANPLCDDAGRQGARLRLVDAADDAGVGRRRERAGERCSECCEAALRRRVRAHEPDRPSARLLLRRSDVLCAPPREQLGAMRDCRDGRHVPSSPGAETATDSAPHTQKAPERSPRPQCQTDPSSRQREAV